MKLTLEILFGAILRKDRFSISNCNKLSTRMIGFLKKTRMIGLLKVIEKINPNAYHMKLSFHIQIMDVFNVKQLIPF